MTLKYKYRLKPTQEQKQKLNNWIYEYNQAYNIGLNLIQTQGRELYDLGYKSNYIFKFIYDKTRSVLKTRGIRDKSALTQDAIREGYNSLFMNIKQNKPFELHFKDSSSFDGSFKFRTKTSDTKIFKQKIKIIKHREIPVGYRILGSRVKREGQEYYIIFSITDDQKTPKPPKTKDIVGIDANQGNYTFSNGYTLDFVKSVYPKLEKKRLTHQKTLSSKKKGSKTRKKKQLLLYKTSRKIKRRRTDDIQKRVTQVLNDVVTLGYIVEKLNIKKMTSKTKKSIGHKRLTKNMLHIAHNQFFSVLDYKSTLMNRFVLRVDPSYTSMTCSSCGSIQKMELNQRTYSCKNCGIKIDRDLNASINIRRKGLKNLGLV